MKPPSTYSSQIAMNKLLSTHGLAIKKNILIDISFPAKQDDHEI